jgi:predicted ATP-grasp superfamily ATP-dependent carboligase
VLGATHTALGVVRALAGNGIPQFGAGAGRGYVAYSRWHRRPPAGSGEDATPESLERFLARLPGGRIVLMPCSDDWVAAVAGLPPALAERFPSSLAPRESVDICLDKGRFADTMARLGLPHPRTIAIEAADQVAELWDGTLRDPFLKPRNSVAFRAHHRAKALQVKTPGEAVTRVREAQRAGLELLLQEYVPGPASAHYFVDGFVDRAGSVRARFARRRLRTTAEPFGDSSCMVSIPLDEARGPLEILERLLPALRFRGVFNAQFKHDGRDGLFKLLDLNPRAWGGISLAVSCGIDVIRMAYRDALGLPVETIVGYPIGRHWVYQSRDLIACWRLLREGRLTPGAWIRTWAGAVHPIFRWSDPAPAVALALHNARRLVRDLRGAPG